LIPIFSDITQGYGALFALHQTISSNTDTDSSAIDLQSYDGPVHLIFSVGDYGDASTVAVVKLVECATSGGSYTAITGSSTTLSASATANDNATHVVRVENWQKRYVKVRVTTSGGTASVPIAAMVLARKRIGGGSGVKTDG
jgi:hypothetical protein